MELRGQVVAFGKSANNPREASIGESITIRGGQFSIAANGDYQWVFDEPYEKSGKTIGIVINHPPIFGLRNYARAFMDEKIPAALGEFVYSHRPRDYLSLFS